MSQNMQYNSSPISPYNSGAISAGDCISSGWELIQPQYWLFLGVALLAYVLTACIPLLNIFLMGPILGGVFIIHFVYMRRQPIDFGMMFKGFEKIVPLMVTGLIQAIPGVIWQGVQFAIDMNRIMFDVLKIRGLGNTTRLAETSSNAPELAMSGALFVAAIFFIIFGIAWHITFAFAIPLIADKDLGVVEAISLSARAGWSNFGGLILLAILQALVALVGLLAICIGMFFVLPIIYASNAVAYRQVFPDTQPQNFNAPPQPNAYGGTYGQPM